MLWQAEKPATAATAQGVIANMRLFAANCLVTHNTLHIRLTAYAMISAMSGR
jgi:hypothetical protein